MQVNLVPETWWQDVKQHRRAILLSLAFLAVAVVLDLYSGLYVDSIQTTSVPDLLLDALPVINLSVLFVWVWIFATIVLFFHPLIHDVSLFHVVTIHYSLLVAIRAAFTVLTHLGAPANAVHAHFPWPFTNMLYNNDLFFSGHVAIPFLGFLVFKDRIRYFFLGMSFLMAVTVLLMHVHYSIDVAAAFFITYGSYKIGEWLLAQKI